MSPRSSSVALGLDTRSSLRLLLRHLAILVGIGDLQHILERRQILLLAGIAALGHQSSEVELILGTPAQIDVYSTVIYRAINQEPPLHGLASVLSIAFLGLIVPFVLLLLGLWLVLDNAARLEAECCAQCFSTDDQKEGMKAFVEKRKPRFEGG